MKKFFLGTGGVIAVIGALSYSYKDQLSLYMAGFTLQPAHGFTEKAEPRAPDYSSEESWAALPQKVDAADVYPKDQSQEGFLGDSQAEAPVDVFFIHPTTYYGADSWNQPLDDQKANAMISAQVLPNQAGVFNSCCKVYVPHYRQATLYSFFEKSENSAAALDLAYGDVKAAFEYFIEHYNEGRPFIVAGHSQGSRHLDVLLKEVIQGSELQGRMVAAYPVGFPLDGTNGIPVCESAEQTGCQVTWNTVSPEFVQYRDTQNDLCVNPLSWKKNGDYKDPTYNKGAVNYAQKGNLEIGIADAQCKNGLLVVKTMGSDQYPFGLLGTGNYHLYDYGLYHMNVRKNTVTRVNAFLQQ